MDGTRFTELYNLPKSEHKNKFDKSNNQERESKQSTSNGTNINKRESVEFWDEIGEDRFIGYPVPKVERMSFKEMKNKNNFSKKPSIEEDTDRDSKFNSLKEKILSDKNLIHIKPNDKNLDFDCVNLDYDDFIGGKNIIKNYKNKFEDKNLKNKNNPLDQTQEEYFPTATEQSFGIPVNKKIRNKSADYTDYQNQISSTLPSNTIYEKQKIPLKINPFPLPVCQKKKSDKLNNPNRSMIETTPNKLSVPERGGSITARENNKIRNMSQENKENKIKAISKSPINSTMQKKVIPSQNSIPQHKAPKNIPQVARTNFGVTALISTPTPSQQKLDHLNHLINKAKEKEEKIKFLRELSEQDKIIKELEGCTFKPKINNKFVPSNKTVIHERQVNTYDRHLYWNNKKEEK
jgi:hypothetical protein